MSPGLGFRMHAERTPNPNSIKWVLGEPIAPAGTAASFPEPVGEDVSPLAARLFSVRGVTGVFIASSFVTVSKRDDAEWLKHTFAGAAQPSGAALNAGKIDLSYRPVVITTFEPKERVY